MKTIIVFALLLINLSAKSTYSGALTSYSNGKVVKSSEQFTNACEDGNMNACYSLGILYYKGNGVDQDIPKALDLLEQSCYGNELNGCMYLGYLYTYGQSVKKDIPKAKSLFYKACRQGSKMGCNALKSISDKTY